MKKFDTHAYIRRRVQELRGEKVYYDTQDDETIIRYTQERMKCLREREDNGLEVDNVALGGYTVATMEAYSGKS